MNRAKIEREAIRRYGEEHQKLKIIEECAELIQAITKNRAPGIVRLEIADVQIMLDQAKMIYGPTDVEEYAKLLRQAERMGMKDE